MKKLQYMLGLVLLLCTFCPPARSQSVEVQQLLLNVEKLNQLREILDKMYDGYQILLQGYNKVKDITSGNFKLHDIFLDALYLVNPKIKSYYKVPEIVSNQVRLIKEYKLALKRFQNAGVFSPEHLEYLTGVYSRLFDDSLQNLDELLMVVTARTLRMSDAERLAAIDRIHQDMESKLLFLRSFNNQQAVTAMAKIKEKQELKTLGNMYGDQP